MSSKRNNNIRGNAVLIKQILPLSNFGNLKAFANVYLPDLDMHIRYIRIVQQPGMRAYCGLPQTEWLDKEGGKHFATILSLPIQLKEKICKSVLTEWEATKL